MFFTFLNCTNCTKSCKTSLLLSYLNFLECKNSKTIIDQYGKVIHVLEHPAISFAFVMDMDTNWMISIIRHVQKVSFICFVLHIFFILTHLTPSSNMARRYGSKLLFHHFNMIQKTIFATSILNLVFFKPNCQSIKLYWFLLLLQRKVCYSIFNVPNGPDWRCKQPRQQKQHHFDIIHIVTSTSFIWDMYLGEFICLREIFILTFIVLCTKS